MIKNDELIKKVQSYNKFLNKDTLSKAYNFAALIHETGHALGLDHPHEGEDQLKEQNDFTHYTLMSYNDSAEAYYKPPNSTISNYVVSYSPMVLDIAAIQYLYGPATFNPGSTLYEVDLTRPFVQSIWDSSGTDTLDLSTSKYQCVINLEPGSYSTIPCDNWSMEDNLGIAYGAIIENANGGLSDDSIFGNSVDTYYGKLIEAEVTQDMYETDMIF